MRGVLWAQGLFGSLILTFAVCGDDHNGAVCNATDSSLSDLLCENQAVAKAALAQEEELVASETADEPRDVRGRTALHAAAGHRDGDVNHVRSLLASRAAYSAQDLAEQTPLHLAAQSGHLEVVAALVESRADLEAVDIRRRSALHLAAYLGHGSIVQDLVMRSANVSACDHGGHTPLILSARSGHLVVALALLGAGAGVNAVNRQHRTALHEAASARHTLMVQLLLEGRAEPESQDRWDRTPLHEAARSGSAEAAQLLLAYGASADAPALAAAIGPVTPRSEASTFRRDQVEAVLNGEKLPSSRMCLDNSPGAVSGGAGVVELLARLFRGAPMGRPCSKEQHQKR